MTTIRPIALAVALAACATGAAAQTYPAKKVRFVVPFTAGGPTDIQGRMLSEKLGQRLGQQFIIDNRDGAGGNIGMEITAKAPPDGYTIVIATVGTWAVNPSLYKLPFDPVRDFAHIMQVTTSPGLLVVHPSVPVKNVKDLVALAKAHPNKLDYDIEKDLVPLTVIAQPPQVIVVNPKRVQIADMKAFVELLRRNPAGPCGVSRILLARAPRG